MQTLHISGDVHQLQSGTDQLVTDEDEAGVFLLLGLLGDEAEEALLGLVVGAVGYSRQEGFSYMGLKPAMYCIRGACEVCL